MTLQLTQEPSGLEEYRLSLIAKMLDERRWWQSQLEACEKAKNYIGALRADAIVAGIDKAIGYLKED